MDRLDKELVNRNLVETRTKAQELISSEVVLVNGKVQIKPSFSVGETDKIELKENEVLKGLILEEMTANPNKLYSATDLMKFLQNTSNSYPEISNQKVSALLRQLGENGSNEVKKIVDKRKSYFQINL